jgi:hypothetical protein
VAPGSPRAGGYIRPQGAGEPGAVDIAAVAEGEEGEEPEAAAGAEAWQRVTVDLHIQRPEELDRERRRRGVGHRCGCGVGRADDE